MKSLTSPSRARIVRALLPVASIGGVVALWEVVAATRVIDLTLFPPPSEFLAYLVREDFSVGLGRQRVTIWGAAAASVLRVTAGLLIGFVLGLVAGLLVSLSETAGRTVLPVVRLVAPIAPIAWIPLAIILFGIGNPTAVFLVAVGTVSIITLATAAAVAGVDERLVQTAATLGATPAQRWWYVVLPAVFPQVFTIIRTNYMGAWMAVLAAEMVGLRSGLGAVILIGRESSNANLILIGMCMIGVCGLVIDTVLVLIQKQVLWWAAK